jgi:hypothetical protein
MGTHTKIRGKTMDKLQNLVKLYGNQPENPDHISLDKKFIIAAEKAAQEFSYGDTLPKNWLLTEFAINEPQFGSKKDFDDASFEFMQNMEGFKTYLLENHQMLQRQRLSDYATGASI